MTSEGTPRARGYRFGVFEADIPAGELKRQGLRVKVRGRPFEILVILLEGGGDVVTREGLRERLWTADTFVDFDHGLNAAMNKLREALGDSADNPRFIETLPRHGYRFIAPFSRVEAFETAPSPVEVLLPHPAATRPPGPTEPTPRPKADRLLSVSTLSLLAGLALLGAGFIAWHFRPPTHAHAGPIRIAVLPFQNISNDPDQEYFVDGMTDALITELAQVSALRVISRTSVMVYKKTQKTLPEIARDLDVDAVIEGSAVRSGDRVRITAQLIEGSSDRHLWARDYECEVGDVLAVQKRVAREVTTSVRVVVTPPEKERLERPSAVPAAAYEAYLRGRFLRDTMTGDGIRRSIEYFQEAIAADPGYAAAHAALADTYWITGVPGYEVLPQAETAPKARAAARKALELDPNLASARAVLAMVSIYYDWEWPEAETSLRAILEENPSLSRVHIWYSGYLGARGRHDEAIAEAKRALELDPLAATAGQTLGMRYLYARRYPEADAEFQKALELNPSSFVARIGLGQSQWFQGHRPEGIAEVERAQANAGGSVWALGWLGYAYGASGDRAKALGVLKKLDDLSKDRHVPAFYRAFVYAGLGETDAALDWLDKAYAERSGWMLFLEVEPELASLKGNPRFDALARRVGPTGLKGS